MTLQLMGKKKGMMQLFDDKGQIIPCTVVEVEPNVIVQIKTKEKDGYNAIQLGYDTIRVKDPRTIEKRVRLPNLGHFKKAGIAPCRFLKENRVEKPEEYQIGQQLGVTLFQGLAHVDATSISKGKGFQGAMKRHHFGGMPASHGVSISHRVLGSTGNRTTPGRCFPGRRMAGRMGGDTVTVENLEVVMIVEADNVIVIKGAIPGPNEGLVMIRPAKKKQKTARRK